MTGSAHNDPRNYEVAQLTAAEASRGIGGDFTVGDWIVRRVCLCHRGAPVSVPFETRTQAERCLAAIERDFMRYGEGRAA